MEKYHGNTVEYWKQNAEENYLTTPISVLKYITVLEEQTEQLRKHAVIGSFIIEHGKAKIKKDEFIAFRFEGKDLTANKVTWIDWNSDDWSEIGRLKNMEEVNKNTEVRNTDKKLHISDVRQHLINHIENRINYFSGGEEMKSISESVTDSFIVRELEYLKMIINDDNL